MYHNRLRLFLLLTLFLFLPKGPLKAQTTARFWSGIGAEKPTLLRQQKENIATASAFYLRVDQQQLAQIIQRDKGGRLELTFPNPQGQSVRFVLNTYDMMEEGLAQKYPQLKTYRGQAVDDPDIRIHLTYAPQFFQVTVEDDYGDWYLDTYTWPASRFYQSYYRVDCQEEKTRTCQMEQHHVPNQIQLRSNLGQIGGVLRKYRLAVSASYSYYNFYGRDIAQTMAGIVATINRVNMIYEQDLGVRLVLVENNDSLIITDPEDPIFTRDFQEDIDNQFFIDEAIGSENYDIGHVFLGGGGGGYASLGALCDDDIKAQGVTGLRIPQGDAFDVDFVAHEIGHQFGANHTFNGVDGSCGGGWYPFTAFEPGAGSTIMAYAGICGVDNITPASDPYFHGGSIVEINSFLLGAGGSCAEVDTIENLAPLINTPPDRKYIPVLTPFELSGEGRDEANGRLSYSWEQVDRGAQIPLGNYGVGNEPLFRSFLPDSTPRRVFPNLSDLLNNRSQAVELLPNRSRELNFQLTVRNPDSSGSAVAWTRIQYFVDGESGPFRLDNPSGLRAGQLQAIKWSVNGTNTYPISADSVVLYLSLDGGQHFDYILDTFPNTGRGVFRLPDTVTLAAQTGLSDFSVTEARLKLKALDNIFFDVNDANLAIESIGANQTFVKIVNDPSEFIFCGSDTIHLPFYYNAFTNGMAVAAQVKIESPDFSASFESVGIGLGTIILSGDQLPSGIYPVRVIAQTEQAADTFQYNINLQGQDAGLEVLSLAPGINEIDVDIRPRFTWQLLPQADAYQVEVALDRDFQQVLIQSPTISDSVFQAEVFLPDTSLFYWRVQAFNLTCGTTGFSEIRSFATQQIYCQEYRPMDLPLAFNALPFIQSSITVPTEVSILDVNVKDIQGTYDNPSGLDFRLRSPEGPIINLLNKRTNCPLGDGFDFSVDDEAGSTFVPCPNEAGFVFEPVTPLSTYDGQRANGRWNLTIFDDGGEGELENWVLEICFGAPAGSIVSSTRRSDLVRNEVRVYPNPLQSTLYFESREQAIEQLRIVDMLGRVVLTQNNIQSRFHSLAVPNLPKGAYLYQLQLADGRVQVGKLLR